MAVCPHTVKDIVEVLQGMLATCSWQGLGGQLRMTQVLSCTSYTFSSPSFLLGTSCMWSLLCQRSSPFPLYSLTPTEELEQIFKKCHLLGGIFSWPLLESQYFLLSGFPKI